MREPFMGIITIMNINHLIGEMKWNLSFFTNLSHCLGESLEPPIFGSIYIKGRFRADIAANQRGVQVMVPSEGYGEVLG